MSEPRLEPALPVEAVTGLDLMRVLLVNILMDRKDQRIRLTAKRQRALVSACERQGVRLMLRVVATDAGDIEAWLVSAPPEVGDARPGTVWVPKP